MFFAGHGQLVECYGIPLFLREYQTAVADHLAPAIVEVEAKFFPGVDRHNLCDGFSAVRDDDLLAPLHVAQVATQAILYFGDTGALHGKTSSWLL